MTLVSVTAYHSFGGEVEASNTPTIRRLTPSCRHQLPRIAQRFRPYGMYNREDGQSNMWAKIKMVWQALNAHRVTALATLGLAIATVWLAWNTYQQIEIMKQDQRAWLAPKGLTTLETFRM